MMNTIEELRSTVPAYNYPAFIKKLRFWGWFIPVCAAPSIVLAYTSDYSTPACVIAMTLGILIFILAYSYIGSLEAIQKKNTGLFHAAYKGALITKAISAYLIFMPFINLFCIDTWAALISYNTMQSFPGRHTEFLPTLLTVLLEGTFLTLFLFIITLIYHLIIIGNARADKNRFP